MSTSPSLTEFASTIAANAQLIDEFMTSKNIPKPSFALDGPPGFPVPPNVAHIHQARESLLDAARQLTSLALGPVESLFSLAERVGFDSTKTKLMAKIEAVLR